MHILDAKELGARWRSVMAAHRTGAVLPRIGSFAPADCKGLGMSSQT